MIVERLLDEVVLAAQAEIPWRPGARELLAELAERGVPCALVTMSYARLAETMTDQLPPGTFAAVVTGDQVNDGKPHPEAYLTAAARLGAEPAYCVAIEDSPTGVASAEAAGCVVVGVPHHVNDRRGAGAGNCRLIDISTCRHARRSRAPMTAASPTSCRARSRCSGCPAPTGSIWPSASVRHGGSCSFWSTDSAITCCRGPRHRRQFFADVHAGRLGHLDRLECTLPSTTPTSLVSLGTGVLPGEHGILGFTLNIPGTDRVLTHIFWRDDPPPERWQPVPTVFALAAAAGIGSSVVLPAMFAGSGLTRSAYGGAGFIGLGKGDDHVAAVGVRSTPARPSSTPIPQLWTPPRTPTASRPNGGPTPSPASGACSSG